VAGASAARTRDRSPIERDATPDQFGGAASALSGEDTDLLGSNENAPGSVGPARRRLIAIVDGRRSCAQRPEV